jgi:serine/threonine protein kinase
MTGTRSTASANGRPGDDGPPPLAAGELLAPAYRVVAHLRRGNHLDVYDLWSEERGCRVVGKALRPDCDDARVTRRLLREGRLLARLSHPHLVRAYETVREPRPVVILETLPGETLAHLIDRRQNRLPVGDVAHLGLHLCSAVGYLHRHGILHLDLKSSNIVASHGIAKVLDLSVARRPGRTRGGVGTAGYMAPEQAHGGLLGPPTDVWGIGAVLYEATTGEPPVAAEETPTGGRQLDRPPDPVRRHRRLPPPFAALIDACLRPEPAARPTVDELAAGLAGCV